ncbi:MAG TPA: hypothetical protein PK765_07225 [bacterium]|nr:hypothetical protein [bacterium]
MSGHPSLPTIIVLIGCSIVIVSCSVPGTSGTWDSPSLTGSFAEPSVSLPSRRPDTTAIIESVNANELVVIEVPQMERQSGSGSGTGTSQRSGSTNRLFGGGGMRMGGGPGGPP